MRNSRPNLMGFSTANKATSDLKAMLAESEKRQYQYFLIEKSLKDNFSGRGCSDENKHNYGSKESETQAQETQATTIPKQG